MSDPNVQIERQRKLMGILNVFFVFFFVRCLEYYVFVPKTGFNSHGVITSALGMAIMFFYLYIVNGNLQAVGLISNYRKLFKWLGIGAVLSIVPIILVMLTEALSYVSSSTDFALSLYSFGYKKASSGNGVWLAAISICLITSIVKVTLFESLYRGYILVSLRKIMSFRSSNIIQSVLYTLWFLIIPLRYLIWNTQNYSGTEILKLVLFYIVFEFMAAFKWGLLTRASGALWVALFDHIIFDFFSETIHLVINGIDQNRLLRLFLIQLVSFAMTLVYYYYRKKKRPKLFKSYGKRRKSKKGIVDNDFDDEEYEDEIEVIDYHEAMHKKNIGDRDI